MSGFQEIEVAVVALLEALEAGGSPLLGAVEGAAPLDRKSAIATVSRLRMPAALVVIEGRGRGPSGAGPGDVSLSVLIASRNLRGPADTRLGDAGMPGAFEVSQAVGAALEFTEIAGAYRAALVDERLAAVGDRLVVVDQHWSIHHQASLNLPTFDGEAIAGADAIVTVVVGERASAATDFAFPGIDGVFRHDLGVRGRTIRWTGLLRGEDHAALNSLENAIEALVGAGKTGALTDGFGRTYDECTLDAFRRTSPRRVPPFNGGVVQAFEIEFSQLGGGAS